MVDSNSNPEQGWSRRSLLRLTAAGAVAASATATWHPPASASPGGASPEVVELPLRNAGFEEVGDGSSIPGWEQTHGTTGFSITTDPVTEGERALRVANTTEVVGLRSSTVAVTAGQYCAVAVQGRWTAGRPQLYLYFLDAEGQQVSSTTRWYEGMAAEQWHWFGLGAHAPEAAVSVQVMIYSARRPADFVVDDVRLVETDPLLETFALAAEEVAVLGMTGHADRHYVVTRNQLPALLGEYDLATSTLTNTWELPETSGANCVIVDGETILVGGMPDGRIHRLDVSTGELTSLPPFGPTGLTIYGMGLAADGMVYCATYPDCAVWRVDPDSGDAVRLATLGTGEAYARCLAVEGNDIVVGTSPGGAVHHLDVTTETVTDITPELDLAKGYVTCDLRDGIAWVANSSTVVKLSLTGELLGTWTIEGSQIDVLRVMDDGSVVAAIRPTGRIHRLAPDADEFVDLGSAAPEEEHRNIVSEADGSVVGLAGNGALWRWQEADGFTADNLHDTNLVGPTLVQSMCVMGNGMVATSGSDIHIHRRPRSGDTAVRVPIAATPIRLAWADDCLWTATYPRTEIIRIPVGTWQPEKIATIAQGQYRPWEMHMDEGRNALVICTEPSLGTTAGAITRFDLATHELTTYIGPLGDQAVYHSVTVGRRTFLAGGQAQDRNPRVGEIDLDTGETLWSMVPVPGLSSIESIAHLDGILYGVVRGNVWFALDLATQTVIRTGWLSGTHSYGNLQVHQGRVILPAHKGIIFELDLERPDALVLVDGFAEGWRRGPQLGFDHRGHQAWGLADMALARFDLSGGHLPQD